MIIQTFNEENEVIQNTVTRNYEGYYRKEMELRKILNYPPFGRLIIIVVSSEEEEELEKKAKNLQYSYGRPEHWNKSRWK